MRSSATTALWDDASGEAPKQTLTPPPARAVRATTVLVVEDDQDIREALSDALGAEGYEVQVAENGRAGLEVLRGGCLADVILLDLLMPVMSGWEFRQEQLEDPTLAGIPVIVVSASQPGDARPDRHLPKPFALDDLLRAIAEVVDRH
jgi:CheY-like chemotaxis protein